MNAYLVRTKDEREYVEPIMDDGTGPSFSCWPMAPVVAETPGRAKSMFLQAFTHGRTGVETDDYPNLRATTLARDVDRPAGVYADDADLWALIPVEVPGAGASGGEREQFVAAGGEGGVGSLSPRSRSLEGRGDV